MSPLRSGKRAHRAGRSRRGSRLAATPALAGLLASGLLVSAPAPASAQVPATAQAATSGQVAAPAAFVLSGSGWGHGVGMSQYGARAQAAAGRTAAQILGHYYSGTSLATAEDGADLRVHILTAAAPTAKATGGVLRVSAATPGEELPSGTTVAFAPVGAEVVAKAGDRVLAQGTRLVVEWEGTRFLRPDGALTLVDVPGAGGRYRHGRLELAVRNGQVNVVNVVRLHDEYLNGIAEMPSSWPAAALDAQAIVARGYALTHQRAALKTACECHVYDEVKSQKFTGWKKENETSGGTVWGERWRAAVARTAASPTSGHVVVRDGQLVSTFYFSSSGGATQDVHEVWGGTAQSHLRSVPDPWSLDAANNPTYAAWTRTVSQAAVAAAFGLRDVVALDLTTRTAGGGVATARATSSAGDTRTITGEQLRSRLALPSTWVRRAASRVSGADRYATAVSVGRRSSPSGRTVVLVNGTDANLVDGLVAAPLARSLGAPVLMVRRDGIPDVVLSELTRRQATRAVVVGGEGAVSSAVVASLTARGMSVERLAGPDRYATAAAVARQVGPGGGSVFVASGESASLVDALSAAGPAAALARPVLLVRRDSVPAATAAVLGELSTTSATCVGGAGVISEAVRAALPACTRASGADRYATAVAVADALRGAVPQARVTVASGRTSNLVDALAAGALGQTTVLVPADTVPAPVRSWLQRTAGISALDVVGGAAVVPDPVVKALREA